MIHPTAKVSEQVRRKCRPGHNFNFTTFNSLCQSWALKPPTLPKFPNFFNNSVWAVASVGEYQWYLYQ